MLNVLKQKMVVIFVTARPVLLNNYERSEDDLVMGSFFERFLLLLLPLILYVLTHQSKIRKVN